MLKPKSIVKYLLTPLGVRVAYKAKNYFLLKNIYNSRHEKRVLISYIKEPFRYNSCTHTSFYEATTAASIFDSLGYRVDVMHYEGRIPRLDVYDVIYGFGDVFQSYFEGGGGRAKTIYYGAGMHVCHQNTATLRRVKDVYRKKSTWLCQSARYVEKVWTHQTTLVDGIIALGNDRCAATYRKHYDGPVLSCPAPFFQTLDYKQVMANRPADARNAYLWFGSAGLVHKGLDLCLEYFHVRPELELHICGDLELEPDFVKAYHSALFDSPNIHVHGFVNVQSAIFKDILAACSFVVFPSCSEGGSPSVLTAIGNGGLIPVVSPESSVDAAHGVIIEALTLDGIVDAIAKTINMSDEQIKACQIMSAEMVLVENSLKNYERMLRSHIVFLLEK